MNLHQRTSHDATKCPYCRSGLRAVPGRWLGRGAFECERCGDFIDFSRPLTTADGSGTNKDQRRPLTDHR
jgi:tRNA(Ile2) C34 agmatinyltransferase TiaS